MEEAFAPDSGRSAQLFTKAKEVLLELFNTPEEMVISNQSLRELISGFSSRLERAFQDGTEEDLLQFWQNELPKAKKRLLNEAKRDPIRLADNRTLPLLSENKAGNFLRMCPDAPEPF
ncbi:hypothetical protein ACFPMF_21135 [Larkinella bovis]|uniref:Uncharacterized protein n=1 Tax=Larkinella bovis TaxID=683041 RepID=A0ABW0IHJ1_9BACT